VTEPIQTCVGVMYVRANNLDATWHIGVLRRGAACCSVVQRVAECRSALKCAAACCSVLQSI